MNGLTRDDMIDALLTDFDRQWRKVAEMAPGDLDKAGEVCRLDSIRVASCLMLGAMAEQRDDPQA